MRRLGDGGGMNNTLHIYSRVSSLIQEEEGTSLDNQKQLGIKKAESLGFSYKLWNEGGQSSNHDDLNNRPVLVSLLAQMELGNVKHLFVYNTDRLSRNQKTWAVIRYKLLEYGVILYTNSGQMKLANPIDDLMLGILSEISQYDNRIRSERSRLGRFQKIQQGSWKGGPPPFGYRIENKKLIVDQFESEWVKKIFDWYTSGVPVNDIRKRLSTNGVMTRRGNAQWSCGSIHNILYNPVYVGSYDYTDRMIGETVKVSTVPIIDSVVYELAQKRRGAVLVRKKQLTKTKHFYLLRDLLVCGHCGAPMGGRIVKKNHQNVYYCVKSERSWKKRDADHPKWRRGCQCSMVYSVNIKKTDRLVCEIVDWTLRHYCGLKPGFAVSDSIGTVSHCHGNSIATIHNQTKFSADECAMGNCAVDSLFIAAHDSLQSVRVDNEPFPPHLHGGVFHVYPGARTVQPDTLGGSLVDTPNDRQTRDFLISVIRQVRVHYDDAAGCHWVEVEFRHQPAQGFMKRLAVCPDQHESGRDEGNDQTDNQVSRGDRSRLLGDCGIIPKGCLPHNSDRHPSQVLIVRSVPQPLSVRPLSDYQVQLITTITRLRASGWNDSQIARHFNAQGMLTVRGHTFLGKHVWSMMRKYEERQGRNGEMCGV
jgi:DNA invertase Pin-like site-specific DNA recombinase